MGICIKEKVGKPEGDWCTIRFFDFISLLGQGVIAYCF